MNDKNYRVEYNEWYREKNLKKLREKGRSYYWTKGRINRQKLNEKYKT